MNSLTATVATRPRAILPATAPPAMSTCAMIQPPKMSPFWLASAGIGMTRSAGCFPSGSLSTRADVMDRSPAERREAGAEDEPGVHEVGVGDDAFAQHRFGLAQVGLDQLLHQRVVERVGLALHRSSVLVAVDSLAGLLAEMPQGNLVGEDLRHFGGLGKRLARSEANVEAYGIGELGRPHRHAELLHRRVQALGLVALVQ